MTAEPPGGVLHIAHASRRYGARAALDDVSLHVAQGEVYALLGRNGAGKSTLAKAAIGALALDAGTVRVAGGDPARDRAARRVIGVAPQEIALYGHLTVSENVHAFATLAGLPRKGRRQAVMRAMTDAVCAERAHERVERLSGGWRRRANLAAAIVHRPRLLVLDEPTEGLDAETRLALHRVIRRLREDGAAILLISHHGEDVIGLADRLGVLAAGRLVAEGDPETLVAQAFGARRELVVRCGAAPQHGAQILRPRGLVPSQDGLVWSGLVENALVQAREIDQAFRQAGDPVSELTVRAPGVDALVGWAAGIAAA